MRMGIPGKALRRLTKLPVLILSIRIESSCLLRAKIFPRLDVRACAAKKGRSLHASQCSANCSFVLTKFRGVQNQNKLLANRLAYTHC